MGEVLVLGVVEGGIYALFAVATVLVYRGSRVLNFAQGEVGTLGLFTAAWLTVDNDLPWVVGALGALVVTVAIAVLFERFVVRRMGDAPRVSVAVATVGLLLFVLTSELVRIGASPKSIDGPIGGDGYKIAGVVVSPTQLVSLVIALAVGLALAVLLRRTDFGLGVLAAAQDTAAARLVGVPVNRVSAFVWGTGAGLTTLGCLLIAPGLGAFAPGALSRLFLFGLAAAIVGGLTSLPGAFAGGLIVGLVINGTGHFLHDVTLPGKETLAVFILMLVVLLLRPNGVFGAQTRGTR
ncbi:MAG TPA: branched-chain amino acid ABC transporter permease [Acidimicrobiales bacterium]|nr:branched-chain amino acid ABC transporter permease [Acidimicrobiales bacterium]